MSDKDYFFKNGNFSFSLSEGSTLCSITVPDKDGKPVDVVNKGQSLVLKTETGIVDFKDWQIRHEDDGFTCHSVSSVYEIWARYSLTSTGVFSIRCKIFSSEDVKVEYSNFVSFNIADCESCFEMKRAFDTDRGFIRFCHIKNKESGIIICGYTDLPGFKESESNIETCTNNAIELKKGEIFESTTSYFFSVV